LQEAEIREEERPQEEGDKLKFTDITNRQIEIRTLFNGSSFCVALEINQRPTDEIIIGSWDSQEVQRAEEALMIKHDIVRPENADDLLRLFKKLQETKDSALYAQFEEHLKTLDLHEYIVLNHKIGLLHVIMATYDIKPKA
jgi:hypothetical protein